MTAEGIRLESLPLPGSRRTAPDDKLSVEHEHVSVAQIEHPLAHWVPLARGPFLFRRRREKDRLLVGTSDQALIKWAQASFSDWGPRLLRDWDQRNPPCRLRLNADGYLRVEFCANQNGELEKWFWLELHPTSIPQSEESRRYVAELVPHHNRQLVLNCLVQALNVWQWMVQEFREAVDSDACRIYARWGSAIAPRFTHIPRDVFCRCYIENWGGQASLGGRARADDGTKLFSIFVGQSPSMIRVTKAEADAIRSLQIALQSNSQMKRDDAWAICESFEISQRGFLQRVWPQARNAAELSDRAPPGRKSVAARGMSALPIVDNRADPIKPHIELLDTRAPATVRHDEPSAIDALAPHFEANSQLTRAAAAEWCRELGYKLSKRAFDRVWKGARDKATLPRIASPGRKPKFAR